MVRHYASLQQWDELLKQVEAAEALAGVQQLGGGAALVPSPPAAGERARVRWPDGDDAPDAKKKVEEKKNEEKQAIRDQKKVRT